MVPHRKFHSATAAISALILVGATGCTTPGALKSIPDARVGEDILRDAIAMGATACRYNLEDMLAHAIGDAKAQGGGRYPIEDIERRPFAGSYVTTYENGDRAHLQIVAGKDASGFCTLFWNETRFWKQPCGDVAAMYQDGVARDVHAIGDSTMLSGDRMLHVLLTPLPGSNCLVTESDAAWRIHPDEAAREWIRDDRGYDPAELPAAR